MYCMIQELTNKKYPKKKKQKQEYLTTKEHTHSMFYIRKLFYIKSTSLILKTHPAFAQKENCLATAVLVWGFTVSTGGCLVAWLFIHLRNPNPDSIPPPSF